MKQPPPPPPLAAVDESTACGDVAAAWTDAVAVGLTALPVKVAVTLRARLIATVQVPVPVQAPLQPVKVDPVDAAAVSVTVVPAVKALLQLLLHAIPLGVDVTVPDPVPLVVKVRPYVVVDELRV